MLEGKEEKIGGIWYEHMIRSKELELEMEMIRLSLQQISTCRDHICKSCFIFLFIYFLTVFPFVHQEKKKDEANKHQHSSVLYHEVIVVG